MKINDKISIILLIIIGLIFYSFTLKGIFWNFDNLRAVGAIPYIHPFDNPIEGTHESAPFAETLSIVKNHSLSLDRSLVKFAGVDTGYYKGKYYSFFPPAISVTIIPLFYIGQMFDMGQPFAYFTICIFSILNLILLYKIARKIMELTEWESMLVSIIFGFSTIAWVYGTTIYQHTILVFLILTSFYSAWLYKQDSKKIIYAILTPILYIISTFYDYPNAIILLPIIIYALFPIKKEKIKIILISIFIIISGFLGHVYFNHKAFGNWKRMTNSLPTYTETLLGNNEAIAQKKVNPLNIFDLRKIPKTFYNISINPNRGIVIFSPILVLGILSLWNLRKKLTHEHKTLLSICAITILLYGSFDSASGGWAFGSRYMIPLMAVLSLFSGLWISQHKRSSFHKTGAFFLILWSSAITLFGALTSSLIPPEQSLPDTINKYRFLFTHDYSSVFIYKVFFKNFMPLTIYYLVILTAIACLILFIFRRISKPTTQK